MKLEGSFSSLLHGWPPPWFHSTAILFRENSASNDCKWTQWTGLVFHGTLNYLTLSKSPLPATESIFPLIRKGMKGHKFHLRQWLRGKGGKEPADISSCAFVWWKFPCFLLLSIHSADRGRGGFVGGKGNGDSPGKDSLAAEGSETTQSTPQLISSNMSLLLKYSPWNLLTYPQSWHLHLESGWTMLRSLDLADALGDTFPPCGYCKGRPAPQCPRRTGRGAPWHWR